MPARKPGTLRIIGGQWRSRVIAFADDGDVRPTPDRVRQTLFDWLSPRIEGARCLDLYAGSGALGLEALSRGAAMSCFVDTGRAQIEAIAAALAQLGAASRGRVHLGEAGNFLARPDDRYNVIFLDPPYSMNLLPEMLPLLVPKLALDHRVYLEWSGAKPPLAPGWAWLREKRAGRVSFGLVRFNDEEST